MEQREAPRRRGRPRGANRDETKARILEAAAAEFGERGYEAASIRSIARRAGVDPSLVHHYFDDKSALVAEVVAVPLRPDRIVQGALDGPIEELGARLLRAVLAAWDNPSVRPAATAAMRSVIGQGPVARMLREFLRREIMLRLAAKLGGSDDAELRAELAASQVVGLIMARYILAFEPIASVDDDEIVARVAPAVQFHLTGDPRVLDSAAGQAHNSPHDE